MRIGIDGLSLAQQKTGVGHYTSELARALAALAPADEFELITPGPRARRGWWLFGLPLYSYRRSLDLFHGTNYDVPLWARCPAVATIHDLSLFLYPQTHELQLVRRARRTLPLIARRAAAVITPSETVKREACELLHLKPERVVSIPEAARPSFCHIPQEQTVSVRQRLGIEDEFVLFVGTIEPRKNLPNLLRAFEELYRATDLRPQLVIVGSQGWLTSEVISFVGGMQAKDRVVFTGYLPDGDLRALYSACRVFVYPSLYEGFGLPLLEAMACGAPVVTSNVPSIVETVNGAARLVSPTDFRELARAIALLLEDVQERECRAAAGMEHAKKFSWEKTASATLALYRKVIKTKRRSN